MCPMPDYTLYIVASCHCLSDSGEYARTVSDLIKRSEYSLNQFLSCVDWVNQVPSANSVSQLKIALENRLIHAIHKNYIVYLFLYQPVVDREVVQM